MTTRRIWNLKKIMNDETDVNSDLPYLNVRKTYFLNIGKEFFEH